LHETYFMQYELVYRIVDKIFSRYNSCPVFARQMECAQIAEAEGYDDETIASAFLPEIARAAEKQHSVLYNETQNINDGDSEVCRIKEIITRYLISLAEGPAPAYL